MESLHMFCFRVHKAICKNCLFFTPVEVLQMQFKSAPGYMHINMHAACIMQDWACHFNPEPYNPVHCVESEEVVAADDRVLPLYRVTVCCWFLLFSICWWKWQWNKSGISSDMVSCSVWVSQMLHTVVWMLRCICKPKHGSSLSYNLSGCSGYCLSAGTFRHMGFMYNTDGLIVPDKVNLIPTKTGEASKGSETAF